MGTNMGQAAEYLPHVPPLAIGAYRTKSRMAFQAFNPP